MSRRWFMVSGKRSSPIRVHLPAAEAVFLVGEFNNWSTTATPMRPLGDGRWEVRIDGQEADGRYCFFVWEAGRRFGTIRRQHHETHQQSPR